MLEYIYTPRGTPLVILDNYLYRNNRGKYWRCFRFIKHSCKARLIINPFGLVKTAGGHTHEREYEKINYCKKLLKSCRNSAEKFYKLPNIPIKIPKKPKNHKKVQKPIFQEHTQQDTQVIKKEYPGDISLSGIN